MHQHRATFGKADGILLYIYIYIVYILGVYCRVKDRNRVIILRLELPVVVWFSAVLLCLEYGNLW